YSGWAKELADWLYRTQRLDVMRSPSTGLVSAPGESERDFRIRLVQAQRERRDADVEALRQRYAPKLQRVRDRVERARDHAEKQQADVGRQQVDAAVSFGSTVLGAIFGRRLFS